MNTSTFTTLSVTHFGKKKGKKVECGIKYQLTLKNETSFTE